MNRTLKAALRALAGQLTPGPNEARLEAVIDRETNAVLIELAAELARGTKRNPGTLRSTAVRVLLKRGAQAMLDDERVTA